MTQNETYTNFLTGWGGGGNVTLHNQGIQSDIQLSTIKASNQTLLILHIQSIQSDTIDTPQSSQAYTLYNQTLHTPQSSQRYTLYNQTLLTFHNQGIQTLSTLHKKKYTIDTLDAPQSRYTIRHSWCSTIMVYNETISTLHNQGIQSDTLNTPQSRYTIKHSQHSTIKVYNQTLSTLHNQGIQSNTQHSSIKV